jgi:hypothetical protein
MSDHLRSPQPGCTRRDHPPRRDDHLVKIHFGTDDHIFSGESLWAVPLGGDSYRIANVPFFVHHVGLHDTVLALAVRGGLEFVARTHRRCVASFSFVVGTPDDTSAVLAELDALGACSEGMAGTLFATNVHDAPTADAVHRVLFERCAWVERFDQDGHLVARFEQR